MPVNKNSPYHRIRMMNPGDRIYFDYNLYSSVRTAVWRIKTDFKVPIKYTLVGNWDVKGRYICVYYPRKAGTQMGKANIEFDSTISSIPCIDVTIDSSDKKYIALFDTGSEVTLFDSKLTAEIDSTVLNDSTEELNIVCMKGENSEEAHKKVVSFNLVDSNQRTVCYQVEGFTTDLSRISEHLDEGDKKVIAIIGSDSLNNSLAKIDFEHKRICLNDVYSYTEE